MNEQIYQALAEHLDRLPGGYPPSETGAELEVLRYLFTPSEAALAVHLTLDREEPAAIGHRAKLVPDASGAMLAEMARKGLVFSASTQDGRLLYQAIPFVVGIWEFQIDRLTPELLRLVHAYWGTIRRRKPVRTIAQMRTIPIGESIQPKHEALPYELVDRLLASQERFAVARCICRMEAKLEGEGCDHIEEACLTFGDWADYYVREGKGRSITREEAGEILRKADSEGLVLQPNNSRDAAFICCCCSCCCGVLQRLKRHPRPAEAVVSRFIAGFDPGSCIACGVCLERCTMDAFALEGGKLLFDSTRCIGCGLCITTCPAGALRLEKKPETPQQRIPGTMDDTWREIAADQARAAASN
jgi:Na+-translocating ferredoxin:NAD+ oxidoreductase subunit B